MITAIADAWQIAMDELIAMYDAHIKPFFDSLANGLSEILTVFLDAYNSYIVPVLDQLADKFSEIMAGPVGDAIHNAIELIGKIVDVLKLLWESVLAPLVKFIIGNVAPQIASALSIIGNVFLTYWELLLNHRMTPLTDIQYVIVFNYRANIVILTCYIGKCQ